MAKELLALLVSDAAINKHKALSVLYEERSHGPGTQVFAVGWVCSRPQGLRNNAKHGATIQLEITGIYYVQFHLHAVICAE